MASLYQYGGIGVGKAVLAVGKPFQHTLMRCVDSQYGTLVLMLRVNFSLPVGIGGDLAM